MRLLAQWRKKPRWERGLLIGGILGMLLLALAVAAIQAAILPPQF